jgi:DNA-binding transcriptional LysR family regulator
MAFSCSWLCAMRGAYDPGSFNAHNELYLLLMMSIANQVAMQRDLEIDLLRSFVAIAAHRNFTRAAEAIGRTQSAVSLQLKRLEDIAGERLFERSRSSVDITNSGEALLGLCQPDPVGQRGGARAYAPAGSRRPDPFRRAGRLRQPPAGADPRRRFPPSIPARSSFELTCESSIDLVPMLERGEIDILLAYPPLGPGQVAGSHATNALHWVAAPDYLDDPDQQLEAGAVSERLRGAAGGDCGRSNTIERPWRIACSTRSVDLVERTVLNGCRRLGDGPRRRHIRHRKMTWYRRRRARRAARR